MSEEALNENYGCTEVRKFTLTAKWKTPDGETNEKDFKDKVLNAGGKYEDLKLNFEGIKCTKKIRLDDETKKVVIYSMKNNALDLDGGLNTYHPKDIGLDKNEYGGILKVIDETSGIVIGSSAEDDGVYGAEANHLTEKEQDAFYLTHKDKMTEAQKKLLFKCKIQDTTDPYPGYFISTTSVQNKTQILTQKYLDSAKVPFLAVSNAFLTKIGADLGDIGIATNTKTCKSTFFIIGDKRKNMKLNEMSTNMVEALDLVITKSTIKQPDGTSFTRYTGLGPKSEHQEILINIFIRSGNGKGKNPVEIDSIGKTFYNQFIQE